MPALWGIQPRTLRGERGLLDPAEVEAAIRPENEHFPRSRVVEIENTHNRGGGSVYPLGTVRAIAEVARRRGLDLYLDGARLMNAVVASGVPARDFAEGATLVSLCFSKGLGAPVGSILAGDRDRIREARRLRKRLGGAMRQAGVLAAAGHPRPRAQRGAARRGPRERPGAGGGARRPPRRPDPPPGRDQHGLRLLRGARTPPSWWRGSGRPACSRNPEGSRPDVVRFVTHLDVSRDDVLGGGAAGRGRRFRR